MLTDRIPRSEYEKRWTAVQAVAKANNVSAMVVWGKGGGTVDTANDLIYLANYCPSFPYLMDVPNTWSGLAQAAVIIPAVGEPILVSDNPNIRRDIVSVDNVKFASGFIPDEVVNTLKELGLDSSRVGHVAGPWLLSGPYRRLMALSPNIEWVEMDDAISRLRTIKTPLEFELLREAAEVGNEAMLAMMKSASIAGTSEADAVAAAYDIAIRKGTALIDAACASGQFTKLYSSGMAPNYTTRKMQEGDIFHCDMYGAAVEGYTWDFSRSVAVGGKWTSAQSDIYDGAISAINAGIDAVRPGATSQQIYNAVYEILNAKGIFCGYPIHGHSYGIGWESPWIIGESEEVIKPGMAIAIECMAGKDEVGFVKFEQNVLVHENKIELLSTCPERI